MRVVIVEDNVALASGIAHRLRDQGHAVDVLHDGADGDAHLRITQNDIAILDINLPAMTGIEVLQNMRQRGDHTPVLLLTARTDTKDRVAGLDAGADDYLIKPFEMSELEARLRALTRRKPQAIVKTIELGSLSFDRQARQASSNNKVIDLTRREIAVLECLLDRKTRLVSKTNLTDHLYGTGADVEEKVVEIYVSRLRKKISAFGVEITTVRGLGYLIRTTAG